MLSISNFRSTPEITRKLGLGRQYHVVVGNPPYVTVKDKALNQLYRDRFDSCHRKHSLAAPFIERFFDFAVLGEPAMKWDPFAGQRDAPTLQSLSPLASWG